MRVGSLLKNSSSTLSCPFSLATFLSSAMRRSSRKALADFWNPDTGLPVLQNCNRFLFFMSYPVLVLCYMAQNRLRTIYAFTNILDVSNTL